MFVLFQETKNKNFNSCSPGFPQKEMTYEEKLKNNYLQELYLYTWNSSYKMIEESYLKYNGDKVSINFDEEEEKNFSYVGTCEIEDHAIFINVKSKVDNDQCLMIFMNDKNFDHEYDAVYFNVGIMLSYGRRSQFPETKTVFVCQRKLNVNNNTILNKLIREQLRKYQIEPNFLKEISKKISKVG